MAKSQHPERNGALEDRNDLPEGWIRIALQDAVSRIADGSHNPPKKQATGIPMLSARNIENGQIKFEDYRLISPREFESESKRTHVEPGDVLLTIVGSIGRSAVVPQSCEPFALQRSVAVLKPVAIDPGLLMYELRAPFCQSFFEQEGAGTAQTGIYLGKLATLPVLLPPQAEQKRIIAKIEGLTARVEASLARLAKVPAILKRFRQSVLAAACSGRLTADWRTKNPQLKSFAKKLANENPPELFETPDSWDWVRSADEFEFVTSGSRGWAKYYSDTGPIFVRIGNLNHDSIELDLRSVQRVTPPRNAEGSRTRVKLGDILISITADVGMIALVDADIGEAYINQHVALARPRGTLLGRYLAYFLAAATGGQKQFQGQQRGATKVGLGLDDIRGIWIAQPPLEEQHEIVQRVEALFKFADAIENRVAMATSRTKKLTQSILAKAFRGELVPTEAELARREGRDYESASVLLDRLIQEGRNSDQERKSSQRRVVRTSAMSANRTVRA